MLSDRKTFWDPDIEGELTPLLDRLKNSGEVPWADCGLNLIAPGMMYHTLAGRTFQLAYTVDATKKEIRFYEFQQISHSIDWQRSMDDDFQSVEDQATYIPQIGDPCKFIKTVEFISRGINTSKELGIAFGSGATNEKNLVRRGDYLVRPVVELGLAMKIRTENQAYSTYILTERGVLISKSDNQEIQERLLAEALLCFYPIQLIISETTRGNRELTKELIQEIISLVSLGDCGGTTNPRRASSLRALVNWVTRWAGIPVRREGSDGIQLYIPYIHAN
jgi:hypothetical protein